jgi:hypothetical protein
MSDHFYLDGNTGQMSITTDANFAAINANPAAHIDKIKFHTDLPNVKVVHEINNISQSFSSLTVVVRNFSIDQGCFNGNAYYNRTIPEVRTQHIAVGAVSASAYTYVIQHNGISYPGGIVEVSGNQWYRKTYVAWDATTVYLVEHASVRSGTMAAYSKSGISVVGFG